ncbi:MAG: peptidoglycan-binding protein [Clostridia bacterium]|nr:peptidoglycan-binding protein [Clostridia bacterium]
MKWNTPTEFINSTYGKSIDTDNYPKNGNKFQCWDLADYFWRNQVGRSFITKPGGNGCILDCWNISRNVNAGSEFSIITGFNNLKIGDWAAFGGSKTGHIGIVTAVNKNSIILQAQNQGSDRTHVTRMEFTSYYFLGAWRFKVWNTSPVKSGFLPARGYWKKGDKDERIAKLDDFFYKTFPAYASTNEELAKLPGNYFGAITEKFVKEFQRRTNLQIDGCVGPITYAELKKYGFKY